MTRTRPGRTVIALGALGVTSAVGASPPLAQAAEPSSTEQPAEPGRHCNTRALTLEEIAAGATSTVDCYATLDQARAAALGDGSAGKSTSYAATASSDVVLAEHYVNANGGGSSLTVWGSGCTGLGVSFASSDPWNDVISSTRHRACGNVKHFEHSTYSGSTQTTTGAFGQVANLNSTMNDKTSSIKYYT